MVTCMVSVFGPGNWIRNLNIDKKGGIFKCDCVLVHDNRDSSPCGQRFQMRRSCDGLSRTQSVRCLSTWAPAYNSCVTVRSVERGSNVVAPPEEPDDEPRATSAADTAGESFLPISARRSARGRSRVGTECCAEPLVRIGEDHTERVDYRPAKITIKVLVTPKYACPQKHGGVKSREAPPAPVPDGRFDFGLVAQVVISKVANHLPLYRPQEVLARSGLELSRSTLCDVLAGAGELLAPLASLLKRRVLSG